MVYIKAEGQSWIISALYVLEVYGYTVPRLLLLLLQIQGQGQGRFHQPVLGNKRPPTGLSHAPPKKAKFGVLRDVSLAEAGKYGTLNEYAFFDKVRKALKSKEVYDDFLRCLVLFNQEVITRTELVQLTGKNS